MSPSHYSTTGPHRVGRRFDGRNIQPLLDSLTRPDGAFDGAEVWQRQASSEERSDDADTGSDDPLHVPAPARSVAPGLPFPIATGVISRSEIRTCPH